jgi:hypothetical protein
VKVENQARVLLLIVLAAIAMMRGMLLWIGHP